MDAVTRRMCWLYSRGATGAATRNPDTKNPGSASYQDSCVFLRIGRGDRIRTYDLYVPNVALYQTELHPDSEPGIVRNRRPLRQGGRAPR